MKPVQFYFILTLSCNLSCPHCIRQYSSFPHQDELKLKDIQNLVTQIQENKLSIIPILTGGEPTLSKDFLDILEYLSKSYPKVFICSNGIINNNQLLQKVINYSNSVFQISIDGDNHTHNLLRGEGSFEKAFSTIDYLCKNNVAVSVSTTVNKANIDSLYHLSKYLEKRQILSWKLSMEQNFNNLKDIPTVEEWNSFVDEIIHIAKVPVQISKLFDFTLFEKMEKKYGKHCIEKNVVPSCGFCRTKCYIYPDLSVRGCTCIENSCFGKLNENKLEDILNSMKLGINELKVKPSSTCYQCRWNYLCNGGCPGYSYHYQGMIGLGDVRCPKVRNQK